MLPSVGVVEEMHGSFLLSLLKLSTKAWIIFLRNKPVSNDAPRKARETGFFLLKKRDVYFCM